MFFIEWPAHPVDTSVVLNPIISITGLVRNGVLWYGTASNVIR